VRAEPGASGHVFSNGLDARGSRSFSAILEHLVSRSGHEELNDNELQTACRFGLGARVRSPARVFLGLWGSTYEAEAEADNPTIVDASKLSIEDATHGLRIVGQAGAVGPGGARVRVTNTESGRRFEALSGADGSLSVAVQGKVSDGYEVTFVTAGMQQTARVPTPPSGLSCDAPNTRAALVWDCRPPVHHRADETGDIINGGSHVSRANVTMSEGLAILERGCLQPPPPHEVAAQALPLNTAMGAPRLEPALMTRPNAAGPRKYTGRMSRCALQYLHVLPWGGGAAGRGVGLPGAGGNGAAIAAGAGA
jgi:hypothetical protein